MPTNVNPVINIGVATHIGKYSDAVEIPRGARLLSVRLALLPKATCLTPSRILKIDGTR